MENNKEFEALIRLLDDPDEGIFEHIQKKLVSYGNSVIPALETVWEHSYDQLLQTRIESIIHMIQFQKVAEDLRIWAKNGGTNLWEGATILARYQYPDLDLTKLNKQFELLRQDIWLELNEQLTALEKTKIINHILFEVHHFGPAMNQLPDPAANFINLVIENKSGSPIALSMLYACLAQSLNIPIYGVQLPEHFVIAYRDENSFLGVPETPDEYKLFFYINPYSRGAVFSRKEIDAFLNQLGKEPKQEYYQTCSNVKFVQAVIRQIGQLYKSQKNHNKASELESLFTMLDLPN